MNPSLCFHWSPGMGYLLPTYSHTVPTYLPLKLSTYYLGGDRGGIIKSIIRSPVHPLAGVEIKEGYHGF